MIHFLRCEVLPVRHLESHNLLSKFKLDAAEILNCQDSPLPSYPFFSVFAPSFVRTK